MKILIIFASLFMGGMSTVRVCRMINADEFPLEHVSCQVSIRGPPGHICGGALISQKHVLTAAHCVYNLAEFPYKDFSVAVGSNHLRGGTVVPISEILIHPSYIMENDGCHNVNDIAVIVLSSEVPVGQHQQPCNVTEVNVTENVLALVTGYGRTHWRNPYLSKTLRFIETTIETPSTCNAVRTVPLHESQLCGESDQGKGFCKGDSGAPLLYNGVIVGVASWTLPCQLETHDVYTNIYYFKDFLQKIISGKYKRSEHSG